MLLWVWDLSLLFMDLCFDGDVMKLFAEDFFDAILLFLISSTCLRVSSWLNLLFLFCNLLLLLVTKY